MIKGKNIILRTVKESDLDTLYKLESDISERGDFDAFFLPTEEHIKDGYKETKGYMKDEFGRLLITDFDDRIVGDISYFKGLKYADGYEIGYRIYRREDRGKGYMTEALKIFTSYMFSLRPISRLSVNMFTENIGSRRTAEKCGYTHEGVMRKALFARGRYYDLNLFGILREECLSLPELLKSL